MIGVPSTSDNHARFLYVEKDVMIPMLMRKQANGGYEREFLVDVVDA